MMGIGWFKLTGGFFLYLVRVYRKTFYINRRMKVNKACGMPKKYVHRQTKEINLCTERKFLKNTKYNSKWIK